nr:helix-turn-helix domain-containing protein [Saccharothrix deserti]
MLLTTEEAAERLGVGRTTMYRLIGTGEVESVQIGRLRRIHVAAVDAYARKLLQNPDAA